MIPTIVICIITLAVFATSVYGFAKVANLNSPIKDIPEVGQVDDKKPENVTPSPSPRFEEINQEDYSASPTPTVPPISPTITVGQNNSVENHIQTSHPEVRNKDDSKPQIDNDTENVHADNDQTHSEIRQAEARDK